MRWVAALVPVAAAAVTTAVLHLTGASSVSLRDSIVAAALAQKSVHETDVHVDAAIRARWTSDVRASSGTRRVSLSGGGLAGGEAQLRLVGGVVYVRGNRKGLWYVLDLSGPRSKLYAGRWIAIPKRDTLYAQAADGLTLTSLIRDVTPQRALSSAARRKGETRFLVVHGMTPDVFSSTLSARASGEPLPVSYSQTWAPYGHTDNGSFSRWNEPVRVEAPMSATPIATVRGG